MDPQRRLAQALAAFLDGHGDSLNEVASHCDGELRRLVAMTLRQRRVRDRRLWAELDDLSQDVYLHLLRRRPASARLPIQNALGYLQRLISNEVTAGRRRRNAACRKADQMQTLCESVPAPQLEASLPPRVAERHELVRQALRLLGRRQRTVMAQRMHGASWNEIALRMHCAPEQARSEFRRALKRLQARMNPR